MAKNGWSSQATGPLARRLMASAVAARRNGNELLRDAEILQSRGSTARATALAVLAEEELAKALMLQVAIQGKRWDSSLYDALRWHGPKLGVAHAMRAFVAQAEARAETEAKSREGYLIPPPLQVRNVLPDAAQFDATIEEANTVISDKPSDALKQRALYVGIGKDGSLTSDPNDITTDDFARSQAAAVAIERILASVRFYWDAAAG